MASWVKQIAIAVGGSLIMAALTWHASSISSDRFFKSLGGVATSEGQDNQNKAIEQTKNISDLDSAGAINDALANINVQASIKLQGIVTRSTDRGRRREKTESAYKEPHRKILDKCTKPFNTSAGDIISKNACEFRKPQILYNNVLEDIERTDASKSAGDFCRRFAKFTKATGFTSAVSIRVLRLEDFRIEEDHNGRLWAFTSITCAD